MHTFVTMPDRHPYQCHTCGGGTNRDWWLDLGEQNESPEIMMPTIYICNLCFVAIGMERGIGDTMPFQAEVEKLKTDLFEARTGREALEHAFNDLLIARFLNSDDPAVRDAFRLLAVDEEAEREPQQEGNGLDAGAGEAPEQVHGSDLVGVPASIRLDGGPS